MGFVKKTILEDEYERQREEEEEEEALASFYYELDRQREDELIENSIQNQIEEAAEQRQMEEEEECRLRGEPYFRPRNLILNPPLLIRKKRKTMESTHAGRNEN